MAKGEMKAHDKIRELAALPKDELIAPKGPLEQGAIPTEVEIAELEAKEKAARGQAEAKHAGPVKAARAAQAALKEGEELAPEHAKALADAQATARELERLPVEQLATEAGYLPAMWKSPMDMRTGRPRAVAPRCNPKHWIYAGARAYHQWPIGKEMTRAEFAKAVRAAHVHPIR